MHVIDAWDASWHVCLLSAGAFPYVSGHIVLKMLFPGVFLKHPTLSHVSFGLVWELTWWWESRSDW